MLGEIKYAIGKVLGLTDCSACRLTHTLKGERDAWKQCKARFSVPVEQRHLDELDNVPGLRDAVSRYGSPCVLGLKDASIELLMDSQELDATRGDVSEFERVLKTKLKPNQ